MKAAKNVNAYEGIEDEISAGRAFWQAASVIDNAVALALESRDVERLENLAVLWMELGSRLLAGPDDEETDEEEGEDKPSRPLGFSKN